jgi:hypothetical protein
MSPKIRDGVLGSTTLLAAGGANRHNAAPRGEGSMDASVILQELTYAEGLPKEALRAATELRAELTPLFLDEVEKYLAASSEDRDDPSPVFFIFYLLGEWREKSAYRP